MNRNRISSTSPPADLHGILGDLQLSDDQGDANVSVVLAAAPTVPATMRLLSDYPQHSLISPRIRQVCIAVAVSAASFSAPGHAAIPLLGPCDPDFRSGTGCAPGTAKDERPAPPAVAPKTPKSTPAPAAAPAPLKSVPAAKSPSEARPEPANQASQSGDDTGTRTQRTDTAEDTAPLTLTVGP
ncbi:MAG: hypothetical protein SF172_00530 [Burkholderiales bacterium]|nr:hypothetical protein [Burkholderiales bacterium]